MFSAKDVEEVLRVYEANKERINEKNIAFIIRNVSSRLHMLYKENFDSLSRNYSLKELIFYIKDNLEKLNEPTLIEILIFLRKIKATKLPKYLTYQDEKRLTDLVNQMIIEKKVNPKLCAQVFYEYALLNGNPTIPFDHLKQAIEDPNQNTYLTPFAVITIIKGITKVKADRRKYLDFAYKLIVHIESDLGTLNLHQQCFLFNQIAFLRLHDTTSHRKYPLALSHLKEMIEVNKQSLAEEDVINVLEGYAHAPHTLNTKLFHHAKNSVLLTISEKPLNLSLNFLVNFLEAMSKQRDGFKLSHESLTMIANELYKRYNATRFIKLNTVSATLKAFLDSNFKPERLYNIIYRKLLEVPEKDYTLNVCVLIATYFLKQNFLIEEFLQKIFKRFKLEIPNRQLEGIFKVFYIYTHPNTPNNDFFKDAADHIFRVLMEKCKQNTNVGIKLLGNFFIHLKNDYAIELHNWALEEVKKQWSTYSIYDKSNLALSFINARFPINHWSNFLFEAFRDLSKEDLAALLTTYEHRASKSYFTSDFVFKVTLESDAKFSHPTQNNRCISEYTCTCRNK